VPFTASDDLSGILSVELWARSRVTTGDPWGAWTLATTGTTSPLSYTFTLPAGYFEFYSIAIDGSANRESAPAVADATTQRTGDGVPPTAPGSLGASATRYNQVTLTWTAATDNIGVTKYTISRGGTPIAVVNGSVTTFVDRSTAPTTAYAYTVNASDAAGNTGPSSNTASVTTPAYAAPPDSQLPSTPTNVTASITSSTSNAFKPISVNWLKSTDNVAVARYAVYRDGIQIGVEDATGSTGETYVDRSSQPGRTYGYTIRAVDTSGNQSAASASATVTTPICTSFCSSLILRPRLDVFYSGFTAVPSGPLYAQLDEPVSDGDTTYIVGPTSGTAMATFAMLGPSGPVYAATVRFAGRQAITGGKTGVMNARIELYDGTTLVATGITRSLTTSYVTYSQTFTGLSISSGTNLRVRIVQLSYSTSTMRSRFTWLETTITFQPPDTSAPTKPTGVSAVAVSETRTRVTWADSTDDDGVQGYLLYRDGVQVGSSSINSPGYNDYGLAPNTTYSYTVRAVDAAGNQSAVSNATSITTPPVPADTTAPTVPTWISASAASSTRINLAWNPSTDNVAVQGYFVFRNGVQVGTLPVGSTSYSDTGLAPNTSYTYSLEAVDAAGNRSARSSNTTTGTPP
jgi:chitodextrinase